MSRLSREPRMVALTAQMELDDLSQSPRGAVYQRLPQQVRRLGVRKVPFVSQHSGNQHRMPAARPLHRHVVIEFQCQ